MPKAIEEKLKRQAKKKGFGKERTGAYVYGTLSRIEKGLGQTHKIRKG